MEHPEFCYVGGQRDDGIDEPFLKSRLRNIQFMKKRERSITFTQCAVLVRRSFFFFENCIETCVPSCIP